jgi:hypothetical protein
MRSRAESRVPYVRFVTSGPSHYRLSMLLYEFARNHVGLGMNPG